MGDRPHVPCREGKAAPAQPHTGERERWWRLRPGMQLVHQLPSHAGALAPLQDKDSHALEGISGAKPCPITVIGERSYLLQAFPKAAIFLKSAILILETFLIPGHEL